MLESKFLSSSQLGSGALYVQGSTGEACPVSPLPITGGNVLQAPRPVLGREPERKPCCLRKLRRVSSQKMILLIKMDTFKVTKDFYPGRGPLMEAWSPDNLMLRP